ncbi:coiled-coil domain-containing protein 150 isoform X3 [Coregonus clupeaformis]|uniref:coiled-coil domain-containing protein 150 isoform X3 n=1 Tax=Coregonus clupeaformis TaxID=59861 RepID=UPI001E1C35F4|nr:coiled-coil domain-containing protein 150 isoform X3 [Coregonus clupeaformis]
MSRSVIQPLSAGATAPEALSLLHQRLLVAEEQAEALIRDMGSLGVSREQLLEPVERDTIQRPISPLKMHRALREPGGEGLLWRQCDGLVSRVCRMESLLQTLKLTTFRLETERDLDPSHSARLKEQLSALQQESDEEQRVSRREVMRLRDLLRQACLDRDESREEVQRLGEALEVATTSKMDVALAAEELKVVKVQMSEKLLQLKDQMSQESARSFENEKSHSALLQRVEEMEIVVEMERRQAQIVQADCHALRSDGQATRQRLQEEKDRGHRLQEQCEQLKGQAGELKSARLALQRQQQENSRLLRDGGDLRTAADKVQAFNNQLDSQCSELSSALRSLTVEKSKLQTEHQATIKAERSRVAKQLQEQDLLLDAARRNIQAELQGALSAKVKLQMELETLKVDHAQLLQSSTVAQETVVTQRELLECTIERLRGDLNSAVKEREVVRTDRDSAKTEMCIVVTKLEGERSALETQLTKVKLEAGTLSSTLQKQEEENRRLMGKLAAMEHQQNAQQQVEQMLKELTDSKNNLAYEKGKLQTRVDQLQEELQALRDNHVESVQQCKLSSVFVNKYTQVSSEISTPKTTCLKLEAQLRQAQAAVQVKEWEVASAVAARDEALRDSQALRGQLDKLQEQHRDKLCELEGWLGVSRQGGGSVAQTLENVLASHSRLQHNTETVQKELGRREQELALLRRDRLQGQREIQRLQAEVEKLQDIMATTNAKKNKMLEPLRKALDVARQDNKKLAQSLEQAVLANSTLQSNLDRARDQHQSTNTQREAELAEARAEIGRWSEHLESMKLQMRKERDSLKRLSQREISELRKALEDLSSRSGDLSRANRELREKTTELEKVVSNQKARLRDQKTQLKQHLDNRATLGNSQKIKDMEGELKSLKTLKDQYQKKNYEQSELIQQFRSETLSLQRELRRLSSSQEGELEAERELRHVMQDKCQQRLEESIKKLQEAKDETEQKMKEVSLESQQISENLEEAHSWFRSKFDSLKSDGEPNRSMGDEEPQENGHHTPGSSKGGAHSSSCKRNRKTRCDSRLPEPPEWERWRATMQRWETKRELARIASGYKPGGTHVLTHGHTQQDTHTV